MAITKVNDQEAMPSTATGTVTVNAPIGVADGDMLVHLFGMLNTTAGVTEPSGLTVLGDATSGSNLSGRIRSKVAASEPSTYTWTTTATPKTGAWVGAYRGLDTTAPVADAAVTAGASGTSQTTPAVDVPDGGWLVFGVVARRAANNAADSFTASAGTEVAELSTVAASGFDMSLAVYEQGPLSAASGVTRTLTSTQSENVAVVFAVALRPAPAAPPPGGTTDLAAGLPVF